MVDFGRIKAILGAGSLDGIPQGDKGKGYDVGREPKGVHEGSYPALIGVPAEPYPALALAGNLEEGVFRRRGKIPDQQMSSPAGAFSAGKPAAAFSP
jgi:hypothetical protein